MNPAKKNQENITMTSSSFTAILRIVTEMSRCLNQNIAKIHVAPLDSKLNSDKARELAQLIALDSST